MDELEGASFRIIAAVGDARSSYIEAIHAASEGDFDAARQYIKDGRQRFVEGHHEHMALVQREAAGDEVNMNLILTHAEDQLMSAESFGILAEEFVTLYQKVL